MDDVLRQQGLQQYTEVDVQRVVEENDKQRFQLDVDAESSRLKIRANQGHTVEVSCRPFSAVVLRCPAVFRFTTPPGRRDDVFGQNGMLSECCTVK